MGIIDHGVKNMRFYPWSFFIEKSPFNKRRSKGASPEREDGVPPPLVRKALRRGAVVVLTLVTALGVSLWVASVRTGIPVREILGTLIGLSMSRDHDVASRVDDAVGAEEKWFVEVESSEPEDEPAGKEQPGIAREAAGGGDDVAPENQKSAGSSGNRSQGSPNEGMTTSSATGEAAAVPRMEDLILPVKGEVITKFGWVYFPTFKDWRFHPGLDFKAENGQPVRAVCDGTVLAVEEDSFKGLMITQRYESTEAVVRYAGLAKPAVSAGDAVRAGETLAVVGDPGFWESAWGPHVHVEVRLHREGEAVDPSDLFR